MRGIAPPPLGTKTFSSNHTQSFFAARNARLRLEEVMSTFTEEAPIMLERICAFAAKLKANELSTTAELQGNEIINPDLKSNQPPSDENIAPSIEDSSMVPKPF